MAAIHLWEQEVVSDNNDVEIGGKTEGVSVGLVKAAPEIISKCGKNNQVANVNTVRHRMTY